jgi:hypothetical protein
MMLSGDVTVRPIRKNAASFAQRKRLDMNSDLILRSALLSLGKGCLEGWPHGTDSRPSFETAARRARPPQDEADDWSDAEPR